jgi:hypothetical protein
VGAGRSVLLKLFMKGIIMKNRLLSITVVLAALTVAWTVYAAETAVERPAGRGTAGMSEEQRNQMREKFQNMSEEERAKFREEMRTRFENMSEEDRAAMRQGRGSRTRLSTEDQLKAIVAMEQQLAKLKAAIASSSAERPANYGDMSEEERAKLREKSAKSRADREAPLAAIRAELDKLSPPRPMPQQMETLRELRVISGLAEKEKAAETKKRIDALIEKQTKQLSPTGSGGREPGEPGERRVRGPREGAESQPPREGSGADAPRRPAREGSREGTDSR